MVTRIGPKSLKPRRLFLKEWRKHRQLTQQQLADRLDTTKTTISRIENGKRETTVGVLEALAVALNCEPADLLMRNPLDPEAPWSIWETLKPPQRRQAVEVLKALKRSEEEAA